MEPIEWHTGLGDSRAGRLCAYVSVGSLLGLPLLVALLVLVALPGILPALLANPAVLVLVAVLALVGGPMSLLYLWPLLTEREQRRPILTNTFVDELSPVSIGVAAVVGAVVHAGSFVLFSLSPLIVLVVGALAGTTGTWLLLTAGHIDPDERTLAVRPSENDRESTGRQVDLDTWTGLSVHRLGSVVVLRPAYGAGVRGGVPRLIPIPARVATAAMPIFEAGLDAPTPDPERPPNPVVAATLALFGLGSLAVGTAIAFFWPGPGAYPVHVLALCGLFGVIFLLAAKREY